MADRPATVQKATSDATGEPGHRGKVPPWLLLVCADLGYRSLTPRQVLIADWNKFIEDAAPRIVGTVPSHPGRPSFDVDIGVFSLDDLNPDSLTTQLPHLASLTRLKALVTAVAEGNLGAEEAHAKLREEAPTGPLHERALALLKGRESVGAEGLASVLEHIDAVLESDVSRCAHHEFHNNRRAAWHVLRQLASAAGRSGTFAIYVCSGPHMQLQEEFDGILTTCDEMGLSPDMVVWDFPVAVEMREMKELSHVAGAAEKHKTVLMASFAEGEPELGDVAEEGTFGHFMLKEQMVPLRRLRQNPASRCLVLSGPTVLVDQEHPPAAMTGAAWLVAHDVERILIDGACPLDAAVPSGEDLERNFHFTLADAVRVPTHVTEEAGEAGLVLLSEDARTGRRPLHTVVNPDISSRRFAHFGYNLLTNRLRRHVERWVGEMRKAGAEGIDTKQLREYIVAELAPYRVLTSERGVRVTQTGDTVSIDVDIDRNFGDFPVDFQVSV